MKKISSLLFLLFLLLLVFLTACVDGGPDTNPLDNVPDTQYNEWFSLDNIAYNTSFSSYNEGQGFFIYDEIDFNDIYLYSHVDKFTVKFDILFNQEQTTIGIEPNMKFKSFAFKSAGIYTIKISGKDESGHALTDGEFSCNVVIGDRPDRVEYIIKDFNQQIVDQIKGGNSYTITAKLFNQDKEYIPLEQDVYWTVPGTKQYNLNLGNVVKQEKKQAFFCFIRNNKNSRVRIFEDRFLIIYDNLQKTNDFPQGVYFDFGEDISRGEIELNVDAAIEGSYFYNKIKAEYRFDNGDTLPLNLGDVLTEGKIGMYISYNEETPKVYSVKNYDYSVDSHGNKRNDYFSNGVKYQFEPTKAAAKIYLAVWTQENNQYVTTKVEGTDLNLNLISEAPSAITVTSVSGSHKNDNKAFMTDYKTFEKKPIDGAIETYLCCDMDGDSKILDEFEGKSLSSIKQYFILNVSAVGGNLKDYSLTYTYDSWEYPTIQMRVFENGDGSWQRFFVAPNIGTAKIYIKSEFSPHQYTLTVNIINKVFDDAKGIYNTRAEDGYAVFSAVDLSGFLKIKEYKLSDYDKDNYILRQPREDEVFEYSINNTVVSPNEFSYQNNNIRGQDITVSIRGTAKSIIIYRVYIIPDFEFSVNGVVYRLKEIEDTIEYDENIYSFFDYSHKKNFYGRIPILNIKANTLDFQVTNILELENRTDMPREPRYNYKVSNNKITVTYLFNYTVNSKTNTYEVEILNILISE